MFVHIIFIHLPMFLKPIPWIHHHFHFLNKPESCWNCNSKVRFEFEDSSVIVRQSSFTLTNLFLPWLVLWWFFSFFSYYSLSPSYDSLSSHRSPFESTLAQNQTHYSKFEPSSNKPLSRLGLNSTLNYRVFASKGDSPLDH